MKRISTCHDMSSGKGRNLGKRFWRVGGGRGDVDGYYSVKVISDSML